jgi:hypothetical protein
MNFKNAAFTGRSLWTHSTEYIFGRDCVQSK